MHDVNETQRTVPLPRPAQTLDRRPARVASPAVRSLGERLGLILVVAFVCWYYPFSAGLWGTTKWVSVEPAGYYGLQAQAFKDGQIALKLQPHPDLLRLKDPYDPTANAPYRVHDMTLYQGRYYLYFGAAPLLLMFPWLISTGTYLTEPATVTLFSLAGFGVGLAVLLAVRRRYFHQASATTVISCAAVLALGNMVPLLLPVASFYQVPMASAYFFGMSALYAIFRAIVAQPSQGAKWLGLASLAWGLAIVSRPNYLFGSALLGAPLLAGMFGVWKNGRRIDILWWLGAGFGPIAIIGVGMLIYNNVRFGSPFEFGMKYQLASFKISEQSLLGLEFLLPNLKSYLFQPARIGPWFPFVHLAEAQQPLGALRFFPFFWLAAAAFLSNGRGLTRETEYRWIAVAVVAAALGSLFFLGIYFAPILRYGIDFVIWLAWAAVLGLLSIEAAVSRRRAIWIQGIGALFAIGAVGVNFAVSVADYRGGEKFPTIARLANWPAHLWGRATGVHHGPLVMKIRLPKAPAGSREPLVSSGIWTSTTNVVWVEYLEDDHARFSFDHTGMGGPASVPFRVDYERDYEVEVFIGSFAPPSAHPYFRGWESAAIRRVQHTFQLKLDGTPLLQLSVMPYDSRPVDIQIAKNDRGLTQGATFSGEILSVKRLPLLPQMGRANVELGKAVEMTLWFPSGNIGSRQPLFVTGTGTKSDLLYVQYITEDSIVLGLDHYGVGALQTEVVRIDKTRPHTLAFWLGSLAAPTTSQHSNGVEDDRRFVVMLDGVKLIDTVQDFYPSRAEQAAIGVNLHHAGSTGPMFGGRILDVATRDASDWLRGDAQTGYGDVRMVTVFPRAMGGHAEPLVTSGVTGAGDFLYVRYIGETAVQFGFDHWAVGALEGEPIAIDFDAAHRLELRMGALLPPGDSGDPTMVEVKLNGQTVLKGTMPSHPTTPEQITVGKNTIGGSTARENFTGKVLVLERPVRTQ